MSRSTKVFRACDGPGLIAITCFHNSFKLFSKFSFEEINLTPGIVPRSLGFPVARAAKRESSVGIRDVFGLVSI